MTPHTLSPGDSLPYHADCLRDAGAFRLVTRSAAE